MNSRVLELETVFMFMYAQNQKNHYNFKPRYSISNMGLFGYNKRFLNLTFGALGSTQDAKFLRNTGLFKQILNGQGLPDKSLPDR